MRGTIGATLLYFCRLHSVGHRSSTQQPLNATVQEVVGVLWLPETRPFFLYLLAGSPKSAKKKVTPGTAKQVNCLNQYSCEKARSFGRPDNPRWLFDCVMFASVSRVSR